MNLGSQKKRLILLCAYQQYTRTQNASAQRIETTADYVTDCGKVSVNLLMVSMPSVQMQFVRRTVRLVCISLTAYVQLTDINIQLKFPSHWIFRNGLFDFRFNAHIFLYAPKTLSETTKRIKTMYLQTIFFVLRDSWTKSKESDWANK